MSLSNFGVVRSLFSYIVKVVNARLFAMGMIRENAVLGKCLSHPASKHMCMMSVMKEYTLLMVLNYTRRGMPWFEKHLEVLKHLAEINLLPLQRKAFQVSLKTLKEWGPLFIWLACMSFTVSPPLTALGSCACSVKDFLILFTKMRTINQREKKWERVLKRRLDWRRERGRCWGGMEWMFRWGLNWMVEQRLWLPMVEYVTDTWNSNCCLFSLSSKLLFFPDESPSWFSGFISYSRDLLWRFLPRVSTVNVSRNLRETFFEYC